MRWVKHMTATRDDEKVARLVSKMGHEGYGLWWMVLETVAQSIDKGSNKCSLKYPINKWAAALQLHPPNVTRKLAAIAAEGLLELRCDEAWVELTIPNLLKYRDEYSRKSRQSPDNVRTKIQRQNTDTETDTPTVPSGDVLANGSAKLVAKAEAVAERSDLAGKQFAEFWSASWKRGSKAQAEKSFRRIVASAGFGSLLASVVKFAEAYASVPDDKRPHVATWLNQRRYEQPVTDFVAAASVAAPGSGPAQGEGLWDWLAKQPPN